MRWGLISAIVLAASSARGEPRDLAAQLTVLYADEDVRGVMSRPFDPDPPAAHHTLFHLAADGRLRRGRVSLGLRLRVRGLVDLSRESVGGGAADVGTALEAQLLGEAPGDTLTFSFFPFDAEPLALGYLYPASVRQSWPRGRTDWIGAPGWRIEARRGRLALFGGLKMQWAKSPPARVVSPNPSDAVDYSSPQYMLAGFAGGSLALLDRRLHLDLGLGYVDQGESWASARYGQPAYVAGASARVAFTEGLALDELVDLLVLPRFDPSWPLLALGRPSPRARRLAWLVSLEGVGLVRRLPERAFGRMTYAGGAALAARGRLDLRGLSLELSVLYRDLTFAEPAPWAHVPDGATRPELMVVAAANYRLPLLGLSLGGGFGLELPMVAFAAPFHLSSGEPTQVFLYSGETKVLRSERAILPLLHGRLHLRWDHRHVSTTAWLELHHDPDSPGAPWPNGLTYVPGSRTQLGFGVAAAVRY